MSSITAPPRRTGERTAYRRATPRTATPLGSYSQQHHERQIVGVPRRDGSMLVIDWLAASRTDARLVGEIAADEPAENARILAQLYLADPTRGRCRRVAREDLQPAPAAAGGQCERDAVDIHDELQGPDGCRYRLRQLASSPSTREWSSPASVE